MNLFHNNFLKYTHIETLLTLNMSYKCVKSSCNGRTPYRDWVCKTHQAEMKCKSNRDDCMCSFCYMTMIIQRDIEYQNKYNYIPGSCLRQKWRCITCNRKEQLSKYISEKGIHHDKKFIITYKGFCSDCFSKPVPFMHSIGLRDLARGGEEQIPHFSM